MPNVMAFAEQHSMFSNHVSGGNATQPGLFSIFYSIPGSYWTAAMSQEKSPVLMELLAQYGQADTRTVFDPSDTIFEVKENKKINPDAEKSVKTLEEQDDNETPGNRM